MATRVYKLSPGESQWLRQHTKNVVAKRVGKKERSDKVRGAGGGAVAGLTAGGVLGAALGGKKNLIRGLQAGVAGGAGVGGVLGYLKGKEKAKAMRPLRTRVAKGKAFADFMSTNAPTAQRVRQDRRAFRSAVHRALNPVKPAEKVKAAMVHGLLDELDKIATSFAPEATAAGRVRASQQALQNVQTDMSATPSANPAGGAAKNTPAPPPIKMPKAGDMGTKTPSASDLGISSGTPSASSLGISSGSPF